MRIQEKDGAGPSGLAAGGYEFSFEREDAVFDGLLNLRLTAGSGIVDELSRVSKAVVLRVAEVVDELGVQTGSDEVRSCDACDEAEGNANGGFDLIHIDFVK